MDSQQNTPQSTQNQSPINPWTALWTRPRQTIRYLIDKDPRWMVLQLAVLAGMLAGAILAYMLWPRCHALPFKGFLAVILILAGGLLGIVGLYFESWLYTLTGSWLGGKGSFVDLKCAVGWRNYPTIIILIFDGLSLLSLFNLSLKAFFGLIALILSIWGLVILVNVVGEAHRFSTWKGLLTILIAMALIFVVTIIISLLLPFLTPLFQ